MNHRQSIGVLALLLMPITHVLMRQLGLLHTASAVKAGGVNRETAAIGRGQPRVTSPAEPSRLSALTALLPGVAIGSAAAAIAMGLNHFLPTVSPLLIAIVCGALAANLVAIPARFKAGLTFGSRRLLRIGVALLGLQLVGGDILALGWGVIAVVVSIVTFGIAGTMFVGRLLGLTWTQRLLIACGFSICGAAAVAAVGGVVDADEEETLTAVALVVIFGTLMIPVIPAVSAVIGIPGNEAGKWAGGSIHEVAQVVAAGGAIGATALGFAVVVKLARVLMLAPIMAILSVRQRRLASGKAASKRPPLIPLFVAAFVVCVVLRSANVLPGTVIAHARVIQTALLTVAMFALGTGLRAAMIRKVGVRPFVLATLSTAWIAAIALIGFMLT